MHLLCYIFQFHLNNCRYLFFNAKNCQNNDNNSNEIWLQDFLRNIIKHSKVLK